MEYTTQMDAARKGIITKEMEIAAKKENMDVKELMEYMAKGQVIIPCNKLHTSIECCFSHSPQQSCSPQE